MGGHLKGGYTAIQKILKGNITWYLVGVERVSLFDFFFLFFFLKSEREKKKDPKLIFPLHVFLVYSI